MRCAAKKCFRAAPRSYRCVVSKPLGIAVAEAIVAMLKSYLLAPTHCSISLYAHLLCGCLKPANCVISRVQDVGTLAADKSDDNHMYFEVLLQKYSQVGRH